MNMSRRINRERVFMLLFSADYYDQEGMKNQIESFFADEEEEFIEEELLRIEEEGGSPDEISIPAYLTEGREQIREKTLAIVEKIPELDKLLDEKIQGWNTGRIGKAELACLRLALYEMRYDDNISDAVAINEAVELAKKYGQSKSGEFVNGVLAKFAQG